MTQTLFPFDAPRARSTDPATSHISAAEISTKLSQLQTRLVTAIREHGPMTALEAATVCQKEHHGMAESYRKRAGECVRAGALKVVGERVCRISGKLAAVYEEVQS